MKTWVKVLICASLSLMLCFISIGYAALSTNMHIVGHANVKAPDFD